jgi:hypothetical protein
LVLKDYPEKLGPQEFKVSLDLKAKKVIPASLGLLAHRAYLEKLGLQEFKA